MSDVINSRLGSKYRVQIDISRGEDRALSKIRCSFETSHFWPRALEKGFVQ